MASLIEKDEDPSPEFYTYFIQEPMLALFLVDLIDDGNEAHVDLGSACMPEDVLAERGRGLAMAKLVLDRLTYRREAGVNHWTLTSHPFGFVEAVA